MANIRNSMFSYRFSVVHVLVLLSLILSSITIRNAFFIDFQNDEEFPDAPILREGIIDPSILPKASSTEETNARSDEVKAINLVKTREKSTILVGKEEGSQRISTALGSVAAVNVSKTTNNTAIEFGNSPVRRISQKSERIAIVLR